MTVSIIICTLNSEISLPFVLFHAKKSNPYEIIIVDGNSEDNTAEVAKQFGCKVVYDNRTGLGNARNIGAQNASGDYLLYIGSDNLLLVDDLTPYIDEMTENNWSGIGVRSRTTETELYFAQGLNKRWERKIKPGECSVIGTPFIFAREEILRWGFNTNSKYSDDTELCNRISGKVGYSSCLQCIDIWQGKQKSIIDRFIMYGKSDREYFKAHYKDWKLPRIIKSLLHPMEEFKIIETIKNIWLVPFVVYIVFWRYLGYAKK